MKFIAKGLLVIVLSMSGVASFLTSQAFADAPESEPIVEKVRAKMIEVVDANGVVRARMGGDLPDAVMKGGKVSRRGSKAAGFIIYDHEGGERGGYVTQDVGNNAMLTLDSQTSMKAHFIAGPDGGSTIGIWDGNEMIEMRADDNGARLTHSKAGSVTFQTPTVTLSPDSCAFWKSGLKDESPKPFSRDETRAICLRRYTAAACEPCLPDK